MRSPSTRPTRGSKLTARTLLVSAPPWLAALGADGYAALADFTVSHGAYDLASEVFLTGARLFPDRGIPFTVSAGIPPLDTLIASAPASCWSQPGSSHPASTPAWKSASWSSGIPPEVPYRFDIPPETACRLAAINDDALSHRFPGEAARMG